MIKIGLVACAKSKVGEIARARELYISDLFRKAAKYAERRYDQWYILSAKYGLVEPDTILEPYDQSLKRKSRSQQKDWADSVSRQLLSVLPEPSDCMLFFHAGSEYRRSLLGILSGRGYDCRVPLERLAIGEQLAWYKVHTE